jgi:hypothetical protein
MTLVLPSALVEQMDAAGRMLKIDREGLLVLAFNVFTEVVAAELGHEDHAPGCPMGRAPAHA